MKLTIKFITPDELRDTAIEKYTAMLKLMHKKIGYEQLLNRLESISLEWALKSGYYMETNEKEIIFKHVSI